jgi:hypothetical protein
MATVRTVRMSLTVGLAVIASLSAGSFADAAPQKTGQGIMVNLTVPEDLGFTTAEVYAYARPTAATFFSNEWDGQAPTVRCIGLALPCLIPAPAAPIAPNPMENQVTGFLAMSATSVNRCTFFEGGELVGKTYQQNATITQGTGLATRVYVYTYTYVVTPLVESVDPLTAWVFLFALNENGTVPVTINAEIAGQSVQQSTNAKLGVKYSFSLDAADGTSRVQNLALSLDGVPVATPSSSIVTNCPGCLPGDPGALDFAYETNAGSNGNVALLTNGDARTILNTDGFAGNNNGGTDGLALSMVIMDPVEMQLGEGTYNLSLTGTVKGNTATADSSFSVSKVVNVIGLFGCGILGE